MVAPGKDFLEDTIQTMEIITKLRKTGERFAAAASKSKSLGMKGHIKMVEALINRHSNALLWRKGIPGTKLKEPSILSKLASVFGEENADITRVERGYGTFEGDFSPNIRIPMAEIPAKYQPAFLAVLGKVYAQKAQAAARFVSSTPGATPSSYSVWFHGEADMGALGDLSTALSGTGHEANVSIRPNGILVDIHPKFPENSAPVIIDKQILEDALASSGVSSSNAGVIDRDYSSIYIERGEYSSIIAKAKTELLNDTAREIQEITGSTRKVAKDFVGGVEAKFPGATKSESLGAKKARDSYRQRISRLESVEAELKDLYKSFEKDMARATKVIQKSIDRVQKRLDKKKGKPVGGKDSAVGLTSGQAQGARSFKSKILKKDDPNRYKSLARGPTPFSPPSGPAQRLLQGPPPKANS